MTPELRCVSQGCNRKVRMYEKYDVNGYRFHTENHQNTRPYAKTVNTGVFTKGTDEIDYYGRLKNVYEPRLEKALGVSGAVGIRLAPRRRLSVLGAA